MATTPNYGWVTPAPTDFVTSLPADFETFADAVDADLAGLLGGTTGQVLIKDSATDHDFSWGTPASGGMTELATGSLTGASVTISSISASYKDLVLIIRDWYTSGANRQLRIRFNGDSGNNYFVLQLSQTTSTPGNSFNQDSGIGVQSQSSTSDVKNAGYFHIPDYANTNSEKICRFSVHSTNNSAAKNAGVGSGAWDDVSAINSITIGLNADNFSGGTYILYGVN
jgi:hypothetical protein